MSGVLWVVEMRRIGKRAWIIANTLSSKKEALAEKCDMLALDKNSGERWKWEYRVVTYRRMCP